VTVLDVTGGPTRPDMTVEIRAGRITKVRPASEAPIPDGAREIDATGKFLIPGLWDMHVQVLRERRVSKAFPMLLASGIRLAPHSIAGYNSLLLSESP
jgi:imidazolonepropionase-like amidohydrolase